MFLYRAPAQPKAEMTPEEAQERSAAFGAWMAKVGGALVDVGCPFGTSVSVRDDGAEAAALDLIGYSMLEAEDLDEAKAFTVGLPLLAGGTGVCSVEIFELASM